MLEGLLLLQKNKFYSIQEPDQVLAVVFNIDSIQESRYNASSDTEILQVSAMCFSQGRVLKPHYHVPTERVTVGTQESWIVWQGRLGVTLYDLDQTIVSEFEISAGDCMTLYRGGHAFTVQDENTKIIEIKNGPYYGPEHDAKSIN
jgi:mannose-6-phosphate isomerase-like protein (cupin superfamily)